MSQSAHLNSIEKAAHQINPEIYIWAKGLTESEARVLLRNFIVKSAMEKCWDNIVPSGVYESVRKNPNYRAQSGDKKALYFWLKSLEEMETSRFGIAERILHLIEEIFSDEKKTDSRRLANNSIGFFLFKTLFSCFSHFSQPPGETDEKKQSNEISLWIRSLTIASKAGNSIEDGHRVIKEALSSAFTHAPRDRLKFFMSVFDPSLQREWIVFREDVAKNVWWRLVNDHNHKTEKDLQKWIPLILEMAKLEDSHKREERIKKEAHEAAVSYIERLNRFVTALDILPELIAPRFGATYQFCTLVAPQIDYDLAKLEITRIQAVTNPVYFKENPKKSLKEKNDWLDSTVHEIRRTVQKWAKEHKVPLNFPITLEGRVSHRNGEPEEPITEDISVKIDI